MARTKFFAASYSALAVLALALATAPEAEAGRHAARRARCRPAPRTACTPRQGPPAGAAAYPAAPAVATPQAASQAPGDFLGFVGWLNAARIASGLLPVAWSPELAADAAANSARGYGHSFMGRARRQNAGMGDLGSVSAAWMVSPAHQSALLDPLSTACGLACVGGVWTYSGN